MCTLILLLLLWLLLFLLLRQPVARDETVVHQHPAQLIHFDSSDATQPDILEQLFAQLLLDNAPVLDQIVTVDPHHKRLDFVFLTWEAIGTFIFSPTENKPPRGRFLRSKRCCMNLLGISSMFVP